jgi:hypothetical protein
MKKRKLFLNLMLIAFVVFVTACGGSGNGSDESGAASTDDAGKAGVNTKVTEEHEGHNHDAGVQSGEEHKTAEMGQELQTEGHHAAVTGTYIARVIEDHSLSGGTSMTFQDGQVSFDNKVYTDYKIDRHKVIINMKDHNMVFKIHGDSLTLIDTVGTLIYVKKAE